MKTTSIISSIGMLLMLFCCAEDPVQSNNPSNDSPNNSCSGIPSVSYEGKTYSTVQIGDQCWLKENLNVGIILVRTNISDNQTNNNTIEKFCYENNEDNCDTYGGLYQWDEIMEYVNTARSRGICPPGWHIPTFEEFKSLVDAIDGNGNALKAVGQGAQNGAGTNTSGFSALLAGHRDHNAGDSHGLGEDGIFWSSTQDGENARCIDLSYSNGTVYFTTYHKKHGFSVRCIKD
ncbi:MAG: hypothetical protein L3J06_05305 [Cyclobacteriaceae bacterium]|nr:hypothetical protein [Cyclobacteriaceae bacterium]